MPLVQMNFFYLDSPLLQTVFNSRNQSRLLLADISVLSGTVFHNISHGIKLFGDDPPVFQQPVIPGQVQSCLFKYPHRLLHYAVRIWTAASQFPVYVFLGISPFLNRMKQPEKQFIHRACILLPADCALVTAHADLSCNFLLHLAHLFWFKTALKTFHLGKNLRQAAEGPGIILQLLSMFRRCLLYILFSKNREHIFL